MIEVLISVTDDDVIVRVPKRADCHFGHGETLVLLERLAEKRHEITLAAQRVLRAEEERAAKQLQDVRERMAKLNGGVVPPTIRVNSLMQPPADSGDSQ